MKSKLVGNLMYVVLVTLLWFAAVQPGSGIYYMAYTALWLFNLTCTFVSLILLAVSIAANDVSKPDQQERAALTLQKLTVNSLHKGPIRKAVSLVQNIALVGLAAYGGMVFSAIFYCFTWVLLKVAISSAKEAAAPEPVEARP